MKIVVIRMTHLSMKVSYGNLTSSWEKGCHGNVMHFDMQVCPLKFVIPWKASVHLIYIYITVPATNPWYMLKYLSRGKLELF